MKPGEVPGLKQALAGSIKEVRIEMIWNRLLIKTRISVLSRTGEIRDNISPTPQLVGNMEL